MNNIRNNQQNMTTTNEICDRCGEKMSKVTVCHLMCLRCGANYDCSDKGTTW